MKPIECINCGLLRSTCEMENGNEWTKNCQKIEGKKHEFTATKREEISSKLEEDWEEELIERLSSIEHERWSEWQKWVHQNLEKNHDEDFLRLSKLDFDRWEKQIHTPYHKLTEREKESDREQVYRYLPILKEILVISNKKTLQAFAERVKERIYYDINGGDIDNLLEEFLKDNK